MNEEDFFANQNFLLSLKDMCILIPFAHLYNLSGAVYVIFNIKCYKYIILQNGIYLSTC